MMENRDIYDIDRENPGMQLLLDHPEIIQSLFNSKIATIWPRDSIEQTVNGWDFTLENGLNIDLKSCVGPYKTDSNGNPIWYDQVCLSIKRNGKECALNKQTDYWLMPLQTNPNYIQFITISQPQLRYLTEIKKTTRPIMAGGKLQEMLILNPDDSNITNHKLVWSVTNNRLERRVLTADEKWRNAIDSLIK